MIKFNNLLKNPAVVRLFVASKSFGLLAVIWLIIIEILSLGESAFYNYSHGLPNSFLQIFGWSLILDIVFWLNSLAYVFLVYIFIYLISSKIAKVIFSVFMVLFGLVEISLANYFNTASVMLGADLYGYSIKDIQQTVGASGGVSMGAILVFIAVIVLLVLMLYFLPQKIKVKPLVAFSLLIVSVFFNVFGFTDLFANLNLGSDYANNLIANKSQYFYQASYKHFFPDNFETDIYADSYIGDVNEQPTNAIAFDYLDNQNYPFLHKEVAQDVLSPFFINSNTTKAPNIVIILVEGLGRAFTNQGAYLGNFTPFIDSLSNKSLYWKNFVSQGGRTFAVLPSLLGSLPFAKNGFLELGNQMPQQLSLLNLLQFNGYHTSFYYGGDASFDNMAMYLKANNINELNDEKSFPEGYTKLPPVNGFTWGYNDKELFRYFLTTRVATQKPQLSVVLTVSTHSPFLINEAAKYDNQFEQQMQILGFDEAKKQSYRSYKDQYASILYTDDALRNFFTAYKKRADYNNTIFLITGDHRMPEIPMSTKIDRYHVPLIIFSPMLKRSAEIASVSTHFDITPSLLAFLRSNYKLKMPAQTSWMGQGLDTTRSFQNLHSLPMIQTKTDMIDFISGEYHLNGETLYKLNSELDEDMVSDDKKKNQLINAFNQFKKRNAIIAAGGKIVPDSLIQKYTIKK